MVPAKLRGAVARHLHQSEERLGAVRLVRRTLDCRRRNVIYHATVEIGSHNEIDDNGIVLNSLNFLNSLNSHKTILIVGAGPAGLFAALRCLQLGMKPVIVERGKPVEERKYDIARLAREKVVNPATASSTRALLSAATCRQCCAPSWSMAPTPTYSLRLTHI